MTAVQGKEFIMNKVHKVIWNRVKHCYVVVSEIAKNQGKDGKKSGSILRGAVLAALLAGAFTMPAFGLLGDTWAAAPTNDSTSLIQYTAFKDKDNPLSGYNEVSGTGELTEDGTVRYNTDRSTITIRDQGITATYTRRTSNGQTYWVRDGYTLQVDADGGKYTDLSNTDERPSVVWTGTGEKPTNLLTNIQSVYERTGMATNLGETLQKVVPGSYAAVSNAGGTAVAGEWDYIIQDPSWQGHVSDENYKNGYADLVSTGKPQGFKTVNNSNGKLEWSDQYQSYLYNGKVVNSNYVYVIDGEAGVFTNQAGTEVYTGTVYGKNNEILMTAKKDGKYYSYWAAAVNDPNATMDTYTMGAYKNDLGELAANDDKLARNDIKEVKMEKGTDGSATISLLRNGMDEQGHNVPVDGVVKVTAGGGNTTEGDTYIKLSTVADEEGVKLPTGSKVVVTADADDKLTNLSVNGKDYKVEGKIYTAGANVNISDSGVISATDTSVISGNVTVDETGHKKLTLTKNGGTAIDEIDLGVDKDTTYIGGKYTEVKEGKINSTLSAGSNVSISDTGVISATHNRLDKYNWGTGTDSKKLTLTDIDNNKLEIDFSDITSGLSSADYRLVRNPSAADGKYTVNSSGEVTLEIKDEASGKTETVTVGGIAVVYDADKNLKSTNSKGTWNEISRWSQTQDKTTSITLGKDAWVSVQGGLLSKADSILFGNTKHTGGIAIGENVKSLNNSVVLGINAYTGKLGNVDLSNYNAVDSLGVGSTSIGSNSYISGTFSSNVGAFNIATTDYQNGDNGVLNANAFQNFGAVTLGSLNSIESKGSGSSTAGIANSIIGMANKTQNTNGSLVFGTANEITNSNQDISYPSSYKDAAAAANSFRESVQNGKVGGAVLAIGGGNKADSTYYSQMIGVQNTVNGSTLTMVNGYKNTVTDSENVSIIGTQNTVKGNSNVLMGDNHNVTGANNVLIGSADKATDTKASGAVILGHNANATVDGGVALGEGSLASTEAGKVGYLGVADTTDSTWKSTASAVSVGGNGVTRQITNVAAGSADTDAVNVAQLTKVKTDIETNAYKGWKVSANNKNATDVTSGSTVDFSNTDNNVVISQNGTNLTVDLAKNLTADSLTTGSTIMNSIGIGIFGEKGQPVYYITEDGLNANGQKITNVAAGEISDTSTDAVNGSQLKKYTDAAKTTVSEGKNITVTPTTADDGHTDYNVKLNDDIKLGGDDTYVSINGTKGTIWTSGDVTVGANEGNKNIVLHANNQTITGLSNTTWSGTTDDISRAATEGQLQSVSETANKGWNLSTNGRTAQKVTPGDTVDFSNTDKNVVITQEGTNIKVDLAKDITVDSIKATTGDIGGVKMLNGAIVGDKYTLAPDGSIWAADGAFKVRQDGHITAPSADIGGVNISLKDDSGLSTISGVAAGKISADSTDAVNGSQLHAVETLASKHSTVTVNNKNTENENLILEATENDNGGTNYDVKLADKVTLGTDTEKSVTVDGTAGLITVGGTLNLGLQNNGYYLTGLTNTTFNISNGGYKDYAGSSRAATEGQLYDAFTFLDNKIDGIKITGNENQGVIVTPGEGTGSGTGEGGTGGSTETGTDPKPSPSWNVGLSNEKVTLGDDKNHVTIEGTKGNVTTTGTVSAGDTSISSDGLKVGDKTYVSKDGLNANDQKVTNVAAGDVSATSKDAVNGSQLYGVEQKVDNNSQNINILNGSLRNLDNRVNRVGAGAAALAALHPLDFDPDAKWDFSAGYGNYNGANAVSVGAFYRPNEDLMFSVGGSMGGGENMVNAGLSVKLGSGSSHVTTSKVAMAKEIKDLRQTVDAQAQQIAELAAMVRELTGKGTQTPTAGMFPDVPENHWAYEAVKDLKDRGYVAGYPDGTFKGDRTMTRYEFAQIVHNALQAGAPDSEAVKKLKAEFAPELEQFTVDTIEQDKNGNPTIQRVRVVKKTVKG